MTDGFVTSVDSAHDAGATTKKRELCTKHPWCTRVKGHRKACRIVGEPEPPTRPDWDRRTKDPAGWADRKRHRGGV